MDYKGFSTKTVDAEIQAHLKTEEEVLQHFDAVRQEANKADAERDRLRKYIQENIEPGQYGFTILGFKNAGSRAYANSEGLNALQNNVIIRPTEEVKEALVDYGEEVTIRNSHGEIIWRGILVDNENLYSRSEQKNIQITVLPNV